MESSVKAPVVTPVVTPVDLNWMSIYIPTVPHDLMLDGKPFGTIEDFTDFFENKRRFGKVKRVDLVTKPRGNFQVVSAFIHFEEWYDSSKYFREIMTVNGEYKCDSYVYFSPFSKVSLFYSSQNREFSRFITLKINKTPIREIEPMELSELNVHQLVDRLNTMCEQIQANEKIMAQQDARIKHLESLLYDNLMTDSETESHEMSVDELSNEL